MVDIGISKLSHKRNRP